ncbi:cytochrome b [Thiorhodococcus mannitoliphagus]|uniref:Cytochrome b n=1 Tax=Thiorhodococcus mannitoliphagus TaxID=329406 RepID=A0A6P1DQ61_9GAMM|nr:cytochrome b/b6 domain-containing protein [Thiorhodococcus mannitoliphagus]NEX20158.1 cytochrome b [Thiorhodococcus mannitoliphagus]
MWRSTAHRYGLISVLFHWLTAITVVGLFGLGLWMVELTYYDAWYRTAPWIHKSLGVLLLIALALRLLWRLIDKPPPPEPALSRFELILSRWTHALLYLLLFAVMVSGYLISTAEGKGVAVFDLFEVPATLSHLPGQADWAGDVHLALAIALIALAALHALAALKHHLLDRDRTLLRMLGRTGSPQQPNHGRNF